jgi:hypothetical protein
VKKIISIIILILLSSFTFAYTFDYPTSYFYNGKENIKVNKTFIEQFENYTPDYLRNNLEIEFTTRRIGNDLGWCYCPSLNGHIEITMYRDSWIDYEYYITEGALLHELAHVYQCRIQYQYPHHKESFYYINIWKNE